MEMMKPELARSDEDEFIGREQPSAQQFQALKDGAAGFNGVGRDRGNMPHNSVDHKAVRVEADYERGLYRCVRCMELSRCIGASASHPTRRGSWCRLVARRGAGC